MAEASKESNQETSTSDVNNIFSDSDDDSEPFYGFTIRDVRRFLPTGNQAELFESIPAKKTKKTKIQPNCSMLDLMSDEQFTDCSSEGEVEGEFSFEANFPPEIAAMDAIVSEDSEEKVEGEMAEEIFAFKSIGTSKLFLTAEPTALKDSSDGEDSNDEVEGEMSLFDNIGNDADYLQGQANVTELNTSQESCKLSVESEEQNRKTNLDLSQTKGKSRILLCDELVGQPCRCENKCLERLKIRQIKKARQRFTEDHPTYEKEREYILNWFASNEPEQKKFVYSISGINVCWKAWTGVLGITETRFYMLKRDFNMGRRNPDHGLMGMTKESLQSESCRIFLEQYFKECCDYLPNSSVWHLTSSNKKLDVYEEMKATLSSMGQPLCSKSLFRNIWKTDYSHVKIPKENRFSKCDICCHLKEELKSIKSPVEKAVIHERRKDHIKFVRDERKSYMTRAALAHHEPHKYLSIAIDGMDTKKTELPFSKSRYGAEVKSWHLRVHLVGVLIHGRHPICIHDFHEYPHDSNLTLNTLLQVMWIHRDFLPDTVFIQMDNTCKENKNQYVLSFLWYLVETEVFKKIEVSFLPVGHTHIDVDQMFSRLSVALQRTGCLTYKDLLGILRRCYTQSQGETTQEGAKPQYARMPSEYAIREWLLPHMKSVHNLHSFHVFKIVRTDNDKTEMHCKAWCTSQWDTDKYPPLTLLKSIPEGVPELIKPNYQAIDIGKLQGMVRKCVEVGVFKVEESREWSEFLEMEENLAASYDNVEEIVYQSRSQAGYKCHKKELVYMKCEDEIWIVDELRERTRIPESNSNNIHLSAVLQRSVEMELGEGLLPVYTGAYRRPGQKQREILRDQNINEITVDMLVALVSDSYVERPMIARVKEVRGEILVVVWLVGSWTTSWSVCKKREGRGYVEWIEKVSKESVVLFDFALTSSGKLRSTTTRELKEVYDAIDNN